MLNLMTLTHTSGLFHILMSLTSCLLFPFFIQYSYIILFYVDSDILEISKKYKGE